MKCSSNFSLASCSVIIRFSLLSLLMSMYHENMTMAQNTSINSGTGNRTISTLRLLVPKKAGYEPLVSISHDNITKEQMITGFAIEVFKAAINTMPNPPFVIFVPFINSDNRMNGSYDDMLKAVFSQEYDGAVGDITIRSYRTEWVDFTMPYSETGVSMLVKTKSLSSKTTKISLMPLIKGLVSATLAFCFLSAVVFWFVEYKNDRRGHVRLPDYPMDQHTNITIRDDDWKRETLRAISHMRLLMVMWFLVLLFLISCYTASLSSLFTAQQQRTRPSKSIIELIRKKENVGYQNGSFVRNLLTQQGVLESQLKAYSNEKDMLDLLSKDTKEGGVTALVDEIAYLKLFLAQNCNGYTLVPSVKFQADGFGFAFPRGSPLVREFSNAILKVIDSGQIEAIQERTIGNLDSCQDDSNNIDGADSRLLDFDTLWILLAGAVGAAILVIILYLIYFGTMCGIRRRWVAYPCYWFRR